MQRDQGKSVSAIYRRSGRLSGVVVKRGSTVDILIIIMTFPYSTCISSFLGQHHSYFFVHFKNVFFILVYVIFVQCYN